MKLRLQKTALLAASAALLSVFPAYAADVEGRANMTDAGIYGWAWNTEDTNDVITMEMQLYYGSDSQNPKDTITIQADDYNEELEGMIGDGWHWYDEQIAWSDFGGKPDLIKVYGISDDTKTLITQIGDPSIADQKPSEAIKTVDAAPDQETEATGELGPGTASSSSYKQGESLGMFKTTGYCNCDSCSGGHSRTYSGTVPKANHTISADLDLYPLGTKLMIDGIVYTVEDKGSSVVDNKIDIYYASHEEAVAHGSITQEVFRVVE